MLLPNNADFVPELYASLCYGLLPKFEAIAVPCAAFWVGEEAATTMRRVTCMYAEATSPPRPNPVRALAGPRWRWTPPGHRP